MAKLFFLILLYGLSFQKVHATSNQQRTDWGDFFIEKRGKFKYPVYDTDVKAQEFHRLLKKSKSINEKLGSIKYYLINGNLEKAKVMLLQDQTQDKYAQVIKNRYLAIIYFIQNDYRKSLEFLNKIEMKNFSYSKNLCLLRTINYIVIDLNKEASKEWNRCIEATLGKSNTDHYWVTTLVNLKLSKSKEAIKLPLKSINIENERGDYLKLFLKLSLYLGQEEKILKRLKFLSPSIYEDPKIRELVGFLYYRNGQLVKAYQFIEDLNSPNSQNIKGNIYLSQKKYELAYAQFKLALKRKINSQNSLERIIPLAWLLNQWDSGLNSLKRLQVKKKDRFIKLTLQAAFKTQNGSHKSAIADLAAIVAGSRNAQKAEVNQLYTYNSIMSKNLVLAKKYSELSCKTNDGVDCWLKFQLYQWEDFTKTIHRDDEIKTSNTDIIDEYTKNIKNEKLDEEEFISQKNIEELDNNLIQSLKEKASEL